MRELNTIKIIAVDHGYGNIKTANTVTPTGVTAYETEPIFSGNILEYAGIYYRIGEGHKEFIADKAMDEDYYILTLMAVARELNVFALEQVFNVIDSRYRSKKPLIVTTNLTLDELKHPKDLARARIYDRVLERCVPLKINNQNIRGLNAAANMQEARKILNSGT